MNIININSQIDKWEQTSTNFTGHILDGEKQSFELLPHHPEHKSLFNIKANIYITDPDTDFILDIDINSISQFDITGAKPTVSELYDAYVETRKDWNLVILKESIKHGVTIFRQSPAAPFNELKEYLETVLRITYNPN